MILFVQFLFFLLLKIESFQSQHELEVYNVSPREGEAGWQCFGKTVAGCREVQERCRLLI